MMKLSSSWPNGRMFAESDSGVTSRASFPLNSAEEEATDLTDLDQRGLDHHVDVARDLVAGRFDGHADSVEVVAAERIRFWLRSECTHGRSRRHDSLGNWWRLRRGNVTRARQRRSHRFSNRVRNCRLPAKPNFRLRRMHVDVDFLQRRFDKQQRRRINAVRQDRSITFRQRAPNHSIAHEPAINKQILRIARRAAISRRRHETGDTRHLRLATIHLQQVFQKLLAKDLVRTLA